MDQHAQPLPYAQVVAENTLFATATNEQGIFSLTVPDAGKYTLVISYVGFTPHRTEVAVRVGIAAQMGTIPLHPSNTSLEEVVVTGNTLAAGKEAQALVVEVVDMHKNQQKSSSIT